MSDGFSADWLRLRESYDARARDAGLLRRLGEWAAARAPLRLIDLGAGTGANLRWTAPHLPAAGQDWILVEHDPALIAAGTERLTGHAAAWRYRRLDLGVDLEELGDSGADVITASALLDLVSAAWLDRLVALRRRLGAALYLALSYDGRIAWDPVDSFDSVALTLVNAHQRTDKGFGPALGSAAADVLVAGLASVDGELFTAASDWCLGSGDQAIQRELLAGYESAAIAVAPKREDELRAWAIRRRRSILAGKSSLLVGHRDLVLLP
jgi:hypothetical protein